MVGVNPMTAVLAVNVNFISFCFPYTQDYDHTNPNWEFLQKIREFLSRLELKPLQGDEEVSVDGKAS